MGLINVVRLNRAARLLMTNACDIYAVEETVEPDGTPVDGLPELSRLAVPCSRQVIGKDRAMLFDQEGVTLTDTVYFGDNLALPQGTLLRFPSGPDLYVKVWYDATAGVGAMFAADCEQRT